MYDNNKMNYEMSDREFDLLLSVGIDNLVYLLDGKWVSNYERGCSRQSKFLHRWNVHSVKSPDSGSLIMKGPKHVATVLPSGDCLVHGLLTLDMINEIQERMFDVQGT
jgi:hypothetical protein